MNSAGRFSRNAATPSLPSAIEVQKTAERVGEVRLERLGRAGVPVEQLLGQPERDGRAAADERAGQLLRRRHQLVRLVHRPDQPAGQRRLGGEDVAGVDPLQRLLEPDDPGQEPGRRRLRGDPDPPEDEADPRLRGHHPDVHGQRHGGADADRGAVDGGDHRLGQRVDRERDPAAGVAQPVLVRRLVVVGPELLGRRRQASRRGRRRCPWRERSMPAQNARPAPVTTTARTASSRASVRKNRSSSRAMVRSNALSWPGRSRVSVATPSSSTSRPRGSRRGEDVTGCRRWASRARRRWCRSRP